MVCDNYYILTTMPNMMVENAPPMKPSHVFFGDNLINGVLPKKKPNIYAMMSLHIIIDTGTRNLVKENFTMIFID